MDHAATHTHNVDERVRLKSDVPNHGLHAGDVGKVCSIWSFESDAYEVEFPAAGLASGIRAMLLADQLEADSAEPAPVQQMDS